MRRRVLSGRRIASSGGLRNSGAHERPRSHCGDNCVATLVTKLDFAFSPDGLAAYACPCSGFEIGHEFREIAFVVG